MERYRSGHNEAVLKTVCPQGRVGSNPTLSAGDTFSAGLFQSNKKFTSAMFGEVPKRLKGLPWKGSRSLVAARGFKSLLLRLVISEDCLIWTLTNKQQCNPENSNKEVSEVSKNETPKASETEREKMQRIRKARRFCLTGQTLKFESLILAQDERWRRA